ncbi:sigma-54-dependent transcriptional regulator [Kerstersia sp.]|uniref:sigma-54-dependent transcriptional regulator n=1 Tax=Kerstersia sp. TaxID=1930783 RepID=UPI003F8F3649
MTLHIAFIDDDPDLLAATTQSLELAGFEVAAFQSAQQALDQLPPDYPGAIISDIRMPGMDGIEFFRALRARDPELPVILITGHGTIEMAVQAMQEGAYDFLTKPYAPDHLLTAARHAATQRRLYMENRQLQQALQTEAGGPPLLGDSAIMVRLRNTLRHIADADADVLIEGETGSGKEVVATLLHRWSKRAPHRLVAVNCGALPENIIESELFGHEAGAFTGAQKRRTGLIEHASRGTLFLDEIESMPLAAQTRLLRVLENRKVQPLGSNEEREVDLRVVAASKVDLGDPAQRISFRADLYYRLNVITLRLPPLRERREDIPLLFAHFCALAARKFSRPAPPPSAQTLAQLETHDWPGNVRELAHYAERHVLGLTQYDACATLPAGQTLPARMEQYEAQVIKQTLAACRGSVKDTIAALGIPRKTFYDKLQRHGIQRSSFAETGASDETPD